MAKRRKKTNSTLEAIKALDKPKPITWDVKFKEENPEAHADLEEIVQNFITGGVVSEKFSLYSLYDYLRGEDPQRPLDPPLLPQISHSTFVAYIRRRKKQNGN